MNRPVLEGLRLNVPAHVKHARLVDWVAQIAALTECDSVHWCDGSAEEYQRLTEQLVAAGHSAKEASRLLAQRTGHPRRDLYALLHQTAEAAEAVGEAGEGTG
jgi:GTP-dependent phosphoenolpyruvate carboxykinase